MTALVTTFRSPYDEVRVDARAIDLIALPGLEQLRWGIAGKTVAPPVDRLFGITLDEVDTGAATYSMPVTGWLDWRAGVVTEGVLGVLLDSAHIGAVTAAHVLSTVAVRDRDNRLVARSTSRSALFPPPGPARAPALDPTSIPDATVGFRPHELPVGDGPETAPLARLTGLRTVSEEDGAVTLVLPASEWFASPLGNVQGGVLAFLAERAAAGAVHTALPAGATATTQDIALTYLRRAPADDAELRATGTVVPAGKTVAHAEVRVEDGEGRTLAAALATLGVHPEP